MKFDFNKQSKQLVFIPLGGSNEIGMNLNLYIYEGKILIADMGIGFAEDLSGVDIIMPDIGFLVENKERIVGLIVTHIHEDHVGGLPYLWEYLLCPIYSTSFSIEFILRKMSNVKTDVKQYIKEVKPSDVINLKPFDVEFIGITHSTPEMQGLLIKAGDKKVFHSGDWKFDDTPIVGEVSDLNSLQRIGNEGLDALVCDSTNVFVEGEAGSEGSVAESLKSLIASLEEKRLFVTSFASNVARLESICRAAKNAKRKIFLAGTALWRMSDAAQEAGYLTDHEFFNEKEVKNYDDEEILVICTGSQGEPLAALNKIAEGSHRYIRAKKNDCVIFSSRKIPGNEKRINSLQNALIRQKVEVIRDKKSDIHVSGHPAKGELKRMYEMTKPTSLIPVHGEAMHIHEQAKFGQECGIKNTLEPENGDVILIEKDSVKRLGRIDSGYIAREHERLLPMESNIFAERKKIGTKGLLIIIIFTEKDAQPSRSPIIISKGVLDKDEMELKNLIIDEIKSFMNSDKKRNRKTVSDVSHKISLITKSILRKNGIYKNTAIDVIHIK